MMFGNETKPHDFSLDVLRRKDLISAIKLAHPGKEGVIVLFAGFEIERTSFRQESSFYYYTGINEPGVALVVDLQGKATLYMPNCGDTRSKWMFSEVALTQENAKNIGINEIKVLGASCAGYQFHPFFPQQEYELLLADLVQVQERNGMIFTLNPDNAHQYVEQRLVLGRLAKFMPKIESAFVDISPLVADQRRKKDMREIELIYQAIEITALAQEAAAHALENDALECEVQAGLEYIFTAAGARPSFPSIVASGKHSTILHYTINNAAMKNGDLVVVDIGADYKNYCADLTRTYPVSGTFTKRQREVYQMVLDTQEYVASIAAPGFWLNNKDMPEKSLHHLAKAFLAKKGYDQYFTHGIGHFLGLDVHDVGDYKKPLEDGDVFTIEPGIYIPAENIGIRIEDDYWVVKDGVVCLSEHLPKDIESIEAMAQGKEIIEEPDNMDDFMDDEDDEDISEA